MSFTVNSKSQLAKLMATENITVEHQNITTAKFDIKNRILYCPIWQQMSGELYDLLLGHEVGHAIDTPVEGWHDAIMGEKEQSEKLGKYYGPAFKNFLNVVEDARIEKRMKRRYPGLRHSFVTAYKSLIDRDFFGTNGRELNSLPFIDRLNLSTKAGYLVPITFSDEESEMVRAVESCETWNDVVSVTKMIWEYSKQEQENLKDKERQENNNFDDENFDDASDDDDYSSDSSDDDDYSSDSSDDDEDGEGILKSKNDKSSDDEDDLDEDDDLFEYQKSFDKESDPASYNMQEEFTPSCTSDEEFRKNESSLVSTKNLPYVYLTFPKPIIENIVTPYKIVHQHIRKNNSENEYRKALIDQQLEQFKNKNDRYISLLAKEFEMRKAAKSFSKARIANSGDLDISKIFKYQVEENLFKKNLRLKKGKSHGLFLLFDRSGSMRNNMAGTIEQILILTSFCRKVNIPFVVYGFGDSISGRTFDFELESPSLVSPCFTLKNNDIAMRTVFLREYLSSNMSTSEFKEAFRHMILIKSVFENDVYGPYSEMHLSNTPLFDAIVASKELTNNFRKKNNLDIVNTIILHDGESDSHHIYQSEDGSQRIDYTSSNIIFRDPSCNFESEPYTYNRMKKFQEFTKEQIFEWYKKSTGARIYGFFISGDNRSARSMISQYYRNTKTSFEFLQLWELMKKQKFLVSFNEGYDKFFLIFGGRELSVGSDEFQVDSNASTSRIKTAFMKHQKNRKVNRVLVNQFIESIAI